ncbi:MAG: glycoside hydrolase family 130 protein [Armatimonadetes bacterium]|nr:glycoside hydrolase family 130 protein [Armatimonadota bacterium]
MYYPEYVMHRHEKNPILGPKDFPGAESVFNPGQTIYDGKVILLLAVDCPPRGRPQTYVAESEDGVKFTIRDEPFITGWNKYPFDQVLFAPIDNRITKIEDTYYIVTPGPGDFGDVAVLGKTMDFQTYEPIEIIAAPSTRVPCLFPEKINGYYVKLDRPTLDVSQGPSHIWISYSPDLIHWGRFRKVFEGKRWAFTKVGPTPPVRTAEGWLEIYHGVIGSCNGLRYSIGAMLLDLENPEKVIGMTRLPILQPDAPYEYMGKVPNVCFTTGCIVEEDKDLIRIYYGASDTYTCLATGSLSELLSECKKYQTWYQEAPGH